MKTNYIPRDTVLNLPQDVIDFLEDIVILDIGGKRYYMPLVIMERIGDTSLFKLVKNDRIDDWIQNTFDNIENMVE